MKKKTKTTKKKKLNARLMDWGLNIKLTYYIKKYNKLPEIIFCKSTLYEKVTHDLKPSKKFSKNFSNLYTYDGIKIVRKKTLDENIFSFPEPKPMTNLEKWRFYMQDCTAPDAFINWGFYYLISSALQRRVWTGCEAHRLFCNLFIIFVGEPGVGKGLVTSQVERLLRYWKYERTDDELNAETLKPAVFKKDDDRPLLFPVISDAITYEKLVMNLSKSIRVMLITKEGEPNVKVPYLHSSCSFLLDELASIFKKHSEDTEKFLIQAFGCGDYRYETIHRGKDYIKNCCISLIAGTQPSYIRKVLGSQIVTDGFASRAHFIYELSPRALRLRPQEESEEQRKVWMELALWIKKLSTLYGECKFTKEAEEYLENWWRTEAQTKRPNISPLLKPYYARKNIGIQKLAIILHFMDNTTMEVNLEECLSAINIMEAAEKKMHFALTFEKKNPLALITADVVNSLTLGDKTKQDLWIEFYEDLPNNSKDSLDEIMGYLVATGKVTVKEGGKYGIKEK